MISAWHRSFSLAFGFGNLLMLGWLAAAAAPILIHLWNKRRFREVHWAAIEYLLAAHAQELAPHADRAVAACWRFARLLIALLVLAVAQPFFEQLGLNVRGRASAR